MRPRRILIVDDEPDVVEFLTYNFQKKGFEVTGASNGEDGINKAKTTAPDLIIADIMMPGMNGITMCKTLKNDMQYQGIPVLFLSAVQDDYLVLSAGLSGAEHYVSKPVRFSLLLELVQEIINDEMDD